jgi:imidazolonepropionase-like amidohydrolase
MDLVFRNGTLIDGTGRAIPDAVVVAEGATIGAVGPRAEVKIPRGGREEIDLQGMTVIPGLMDLHVHLYSRSEADNYYQTAEKRALLFETDAYLATRMVEHARQMLEYGFTTIRDMGAPRDINIDVSRALRDGVAKGPRIIPTATVAMSTVPGDQGSHGAEGPGYTGPVETRKGARQKIAAGAEVIHVIAGGAGYGKFGPKVLTLSVEEMAAAIEETHKLGRRTTAHSNSAEGMRNAVLAGTQCIEHGQYLYEDDELIKMMVDRRVGWVPTLRINYNEMENIEAAKARGEAPPYPEYLEARIAAMIEPHRRSYEKAMEAGVLVAMGSDLGGPNPVGGVHAFELEMFVKYGATPMQAIEAATRVAAEVLRMEDRVGTVEAGKEADLVVLKEDPLKDIRVLQNRENIVLVIQAGQIVLDHRNGQARP